MTTPARWQWINATTRVLVRGGEVLATVIIIRHLFCYRWSTPSGQIGEADTWARTYRAVRKALRECQ